MNVNFLTVSDAGRITDGVIESDADERACAAAQIRAPRHVPLQRADFPGFRTWHGRFGKANLPATFLVKAAFLEAVRAAGPDDPLPSMNVTGTIHGTLAVTWRVEHHGDTQRAAVLGIAASSVRCALEHALTDLYLAVPAGDTSHTARLENLSKAIAGLTAEQLTLPGGAPAGLLLRAMSSMRLELRAAGHIRAPR